MGWCGVFGAMVVVWVWMSCVVCLCLVVGFVFFCERNCCFCGVFLLVCVVGYLVGMMIWLHLEVLVWVWV